jgi:hypothetical protein
MYTLMTDVELRKKLVSEGPSLLSSMLVSEAFYKFHSFSLECLALLATWFVFSYLFSVVRGLRTTKQNPPEATHSEV